MPSTAASPSLQSRVPWKVCRQMAEGQQDVSYLSSRRLGGPERLGVTTGGGLTLPVVALSHLALPALDELMHICVFALSHTHRPMHYLTCWWSTLLSIIIFFFVEMPHCTFDVFFNRITFHTPFPLCKCTQVLTFK